MTPLVALLALYTASQECTAAIGKARAAFASQQFESAAGEFERASRLCADRTAVLVPYGQVLYLLGKDSEAERAFLEAVQLKPADANARYHLSRFYYQQNRFPPALEHGLKAIEADPGHYRAHDNVALCHAALNQDAEATRHFLKAIQLVYKDHPTYDLAYADFANFLLERNQYEKAFQLAAEAAQRNPNSARNFHLTGKALLRLDKAELSLRWLEQAEKLDPEFAEAPYTLAQAYRKLGRAEDAGRALERFKELSKKPRPRR